MQDYALYLICTECKNLKVVKYHWFIRIQNVTHVYRKAKNLKINSDRYSEANINALFWVIYHCKSLHPSVHVLHNGICSRCGRRSKMQIA